MTQSNKVIKVISRYVRGKVTMYQISTCLEGKASTAHIRADQLENLESQAQRGLCKIEYLVKK